MYLLAHLTQWGFAEQPGARGYKDAWNSLSHQPAFKGINNSPLFYLNWVEHVTISHIQQLIYLSCDYYYYFPVEFSFSGMPTSSFLII